MLDIFVDISLPILVSSELKYNLIAVQLAFVQEDRWEIRLIYRIWMYLALDCHTRIILVARARLCDWATTREPVASIDHTAWLRR